MDDFLTDGAEEFPRPKLTFGSAGAFAFVALIEKDDINIGAEIQLARAELAHADYDKSIRLLCAGQVQISVIPFYLRPTESVRRLERCIRQRAQFAHRFFHTDRRHQIACTY